MLSKEKQLRSNNDKQKQNWSKKSMNAVGTAQNVLGYFLKLLACVSYGPKVKQPGVTETKVGTKLL